MMLQKIGIILWLSLIIWLWILSGYPLVFWSSYESSNYIQTAPQTSQARFVSDLGRTVYLDHDELRSLILVFRGWNDVKTHTIHSVCENDSRYMFSHKDIHFFFLSYKDIECTNATVALKNNDTIITRSIGVLKFSSQAWELSHLLDMNDARLSEQDRELGVRLRNVGIFRNYTGDITLQTLPNHFKKYQALEMLYLRSMISHIQTWRRMKYISPVPGYNVQKQANKVPNAGRPYRAWYTDGIHHGWDIDAPLGTPVIALDDGIIVRVRDGFQASDFREIIYGDNLSYEQKLKNLDVLRGNQVWHKTLKWEVIFYSHLDEVSSELQDGMYIEKWTYLGTIGITWVPGTGYEDFHLHFDVKIPPFTSGNEWKYTLMDYMKWPWSGKWQSQAEVYSLIDSMFEK